MYTKSNVLVVVALAWAAAQAALGGPLGSGITYQGQLKQSGVPVTGAADMIFKLWNAQAGGAQVGPTLTFDGAGGNPLPVVVTGGLFTAELNFGAASYDGDERWLEIQVRYPSGGGAYTPLTPRQKLTAAPYALYALKSPGSGLWASNGSGTYNTTGNFVGINRSNPLTGAEYFGIQAPVTGTGYGGMYIATDGTNARPFYGYTTGEESAWTYLEGSTNKWHLFHAGATRLTVTADGDVGVGNVNPTAKLELSSTTGDGIRASTSAALSVGVSGTGTTAGVRGQSGASGGYGVHGINNTTGGEGVRGSTSASGAAGVAGYANFGTGVYGQTSNGYALYGSCPGGPGYAGYFNGSAHVNGTLSKNAGSFKIDHPLDPANKYLLHSFVESPDMMNIYNGNVTTDADGLAMVELPEWFEALNRDFRYQLTVMGQFAQAIVAEKIRAGRFVIQTDKANVEVSWQVTGIRHDVWAETHRIPVEELKPANERGLYLHPELYGQPAELQIAPDRRAAVVAEE